MNNPLVSIIVPIYNVENYLPDCVHSLVEQTYKNLEIILVDDGSPDDCGNICDQFASKDDRIVVIHKENGGLSDARNAGLDIAKGDYISFVDSDDLVNVDFIYELVKNALTTNADISMCRFARIDERTNYKMYVSIPIVEDRKIQLLQKGYCFENLYYDNIDLSINLIVAWNKLYKKNIFTEIRYPYGLIHEDEYIIHLLYSKALIIVYSYLPLYGYRSRSNSIMQNIKEINYKIKTEILEERMSFFKKNKFKKAFFKNKLKLYSYYLILYSTYNNKEAQTRIKNNWLFVLRYFFLKHPIAFFKILK